MNATCPPLMLSAGATVYLSGAPWMNLFSMVLYGSSMLLPGSVPFQSHLLWSPANTSIEDTGNCE